MKLLLIHNFYRSTNVGGEDLIFRQELNDLTEKLGSDNVFSYTVSNDQLKTWRMPFLIWFSVTHFFHVYSFVKRKNIELVHVHNFFPMLTPIVFLAAKLAGAKVVHTLHNYRIWCISGILYRDKVGACELCVKKTLPFSGIRYACYRDSHVQSILAQSAFWFYRFFSLFQFVDRFFVLSEFQFKKVLALGIAQEKIIQKANGVRSFPVQGAKKQGFLYVGRLEHAKGVEALLEVWLSLGEAFQLTLIGGDPVRVQEFRSRYPQQNIHFTGTLSHEEVILRIAQSKYLLQTSLLYETFGLTILEAMSVGTPVIGFNIGTRPEFIQNEVNGFICSPEHLKKTVETALHWGGYEALMRAAELTAKGFDRKVIIEKQIRHYEAILGL